MNIDEIKKNAPDGATHYLSKVYYRIICDLEVYVQNDNGEWVFLCHADNGMPANLINIVNYSPNKPQLN
ncbi:hypothetical protein ACLD0L_00135 [Acinetobacter baumannii]